MCFVGRQASGLRGWDTIHLRLDDLIRAGHNTTNDALEFEARQDDTNAF